MIICDDLIVYCFIVILLYSEQTRSLLPSIHLIWSLARDRDSRIVGILYDAHFLKFDFSFLIMTEIDVMLYNDHIFEK